MIAVLDRADVDFLPAHVDDSRGERVVTWGCYPSVPAGAHLMRVRVDFTRGRGGLTLALK